MTTLAVNLEDEDRDFIEDAVKSGYYRSESEVIAEAVAEWRSRKMMEQFDLEELRGALERSLESSARGDRVPWDPARMKALIRERAAAAADSV